MATVLPILDPTALRAMRRLILPRDRDVASEMIDLFLEYSPGLLRDLERTNASDDRERLNLVVQRLTGSSVTIGGLRLAALCMVLESEMQAGTTVDLHLARVGLEEAYALLVTALEQERPSSADAPSPALPERLDSTFLSRSIGESLLTGIAPGDLGSS